MKERYRIKGEHYFLGGTCHAPEDGPINDEITLAPLEFTSEEDAYKYLHEDMGATEKTRMTDGSEAWQAPGTLCCSHGQYAKSCYKVYCVTKEKIMSGPKNTRYYNPQEPVPRYPLELSTSLSIKLWSPEGEFRWTIAYFTFDDEGAHVKFVGDRPFDKRVNWQHFRELLEHGQLLADRKVPEGKDN